MKKGLILWLTLCCLWGGTIAYAANSHEDEPTGISLQYNISEEFQASVCPAPSPEAASLSFSQELSQFFPSLFDTQQWPARWECGTWSPFLGWLYIGSDFIIWVAYFTIPFMLFSFVYRRGKEVPFKAIFLWFIGFILACGLTHLVDATIFWWPVYRLSAFLKFLTAFVSLGTVFALTKIAPRVLELKSPETLEKLVQQRTAELQQANQQLVKEIAQREKAENAFRESEERFQKVFQLNPTGQILIRLRDSQILDVNDTAAQQIGYTREELIGKTPVALGIIYNDVIRHHQQVLAQGLESFKDEHSFQTAGGEQRHLLANIAKLELGGEACMLLIGVDITEQKQAEQKLQTSEKRFRALVDASAQIVWTTEASGEVQEDSPSWRSFTGQTYEQWKGYGWLEVIHPDDQKRVAAEWKIALEQADILSTQYRLKNTAGEWRWTSVRGVPLHNQQGIYGWVGMNTDITEQKSAETALQESGSRLKQLIESLPQLVWTCEPDGPCDFLSKQWVEYTGIPEKEQLGFGWLEQIHPDDRAATDTAWNYAAENNTDFRKEFRIRRHDGVYRWFDTLATRLYDTDGNPVKWFGTNTDIEDKKQATLEVQRLNNELEQRVIERTAELQATIQELEDFSYSISHDLRAPLRHINAYSDILQEDYRDQLSDDGKSILDIIKKRALKMGELIDDLLAFSRMGRKGMASETINTKKLVDEVTKDLMALVEGREINVVLHKLENIQGDYAMLKQVWVNLIGNAIKYTRGVENVTIEIGSVREPGQTKYFIKDNGVGFDMRHESKLFGVFQRLHKEEEFEGTGVGLALVKRIVERHGGSIWAEAKVNAGATFYFTLPDRS